MDNCQSGKSEIKYFSKPENPTQQENGVKYKIYYSIR